jgi:hypothetical protein
MDDDGYLSTDATVALLVVTIGLVIVLQAQSVALGLGRRAAETRLATAGALRVLETQWPGLAKPGQLASEDHAWRLTAVALPASPAGPGLCRIDVSFHAQGARTPARLSTVRFCGGQHGG